MNSDEHDPRRSTGTPAWSAWALLLALHGAAAQPGASAPSADARIVYFGNLPEIAAPGPGLPEAAGLIDTLREEGIDLQVLHGGDSLAPSTLSAFDRGAHMVALLNSFDPAAMAVAKREFAYGEDELTLRAYEATFPFVNNNLYDPATGGGLDGLVESAAFSAGGERVCVTAAVSSDLESSYLPVRVRGLDGVQATREVAGRLRAGGCERVIALFGEIDPKQRALLGPRSADVVISAESERPTRIIDDDGRLLVHVDANRPQAVVIELWHASPGSAVRQSARIVPLAEAPRSAAMAERIDAHRERLARILAMPVGVTRTALDTRREIVRSRETAFGNVVADALRASVDADVALINAGGIRGNRRYVAGTELTRGDVQGELPFRNRVILLEVSGAQLRAALEHGLARYRELAGAFPQVSGLQLRFDPQAPPGQRLLALRSERGPVREEALYTLATVDFLARGGDGYTALQQGRRLRSSINALAWETVRSYISTLETIAPRVEGRVVNIRE